MMRIATMVIGSLVLAASTAGQTPDHLAEKTGVPAVQFPLRLSYTRLHPDRVTVLDPRFDTSPAEAIKLLVVYSGGAVMLYDTVTNQALWPAPVNCKYEPALLLLDEKRLVFAITTQLICVARSDGRVLWRVGEKTSTNPDDDPEWQVSLMDFAFAADRLICLNDRRELMCVNLSDGSIAWRVPDGPRNPGYLVADSQFVVTYDENAISGSLTSRSLDTGHTLTTVPFDRDTNLQFIKRISDKKILAVTSKQLVSFDSHSLGMNWRVKNRPTVFASTLLIDGGNIFVSDDGKTLTRYAVETGERKWRSTPLAMQDENLLWTVSAGSMVVGATPRVIGAFDTSTGRSHWRYSNSQFMNEQSPVLIQDALLCHGLLAPASRPSTRPASSQPARIPLVLRRIKLVDGAGGDSPESTLVTEPLQSFGGLHVRNHVVIVLDGNRVIGYVDTTVQMRP